MGAQFEAYAAQRVRGAMLDGLRENDWLPRSLRRNCRRIEAAIAQLEQENGRAPTEKELADSLGMTLADYQKMLQDARGHQLVYLEDMVSRARRGFPRASSGGRGAIRRSSSRTRISVRRWCRRSNFCRSVKS
jgi:RNA polymerase sigma factor for flagellar operon FliA